MLDKTSYPSGPVLRDGKSVGELIDHEKRTIDLRIGSDPEIYEMELERLWAKAWIVVGHESEVPNVGDYITRDVGEDRIILVRDKDKSIKALLNVCPHKGMQVCRTDAGNAASFRCIYHGWTFNLDGGFRGAPFKEDMYGAALNPQEQRLRPARIGVVAGVIFVCWDESAPSLDDFLGDMKFYFEMIFARGPSGVEILGPPQRWIINANWKTLAEQFGGDNYHSVTLHRSMAEMGLVHGDPNDYNSWGLNNIKISTEQGHNLIAFDLRTMYNSIAAATGGDLTAMEKLAKYPPSGLPLEMLDSLKDRFSEDEIKMLAETPPSVGGLFPNVAIIAFMAPLPDGALAATYGLHSFVPKGPDKMEYIHWNFVARGADKDYRELAMISSTLNVSAAGFVEQDDNEIYASLQRSARGFIGRQSKMQYLALAGDTFPKDWLGGGAIHTGFSKDDGQWKWWKRYFDYMAGAV